MNPNEILLVFFALANWVGAIAIVWFVFFVRREIKYFRQKEIFGTIEDDKFRFPPDLRADETPLAGRFVCHWILHHDRSIKFEEYSKYSHRVQIGILEVLMAYDRVVNHFDLGLSKKAVVKFKGGEFRDLWRIMEPVVLQLRREPNGFPSLCYALQKFVKSDEFERLLTRMQTDASLPIRM
ncbi:MAG TPA: hypothetical protein VM532_12315 [Burkholderiales bacterium]|jgi:hypothetical protein|nr:hypothetical protein [Burkholderiales bacterium]